MKTSVRIKLTSILLASFFLAGFETTWSRGDNNPQAVAMGGAFTALGRGYEAPNWNPANLGLSDGGPFSLNIFGLGVKVRNNSFSLADYNRYNGKFLDESDKDRILDAIPSDGLSLDLGAEVSAFNFSMQNLAISYEAVGASSFAIDKDPVKLLFLGNAVVNEVSLSDSRGEGYVLGDLALSYGLTVKRWLGGELAVGAGLHYLEGLAFEKITDADGGVVTTDTGFVGSGRMTIRSSRGGSGYAADLGAALRFERDWYFSAVWQNLAAKMAWNTNNEDLLLSFDMKPVTLESLAENDSDSLVTSSDSSVSIGDFSTHPAPQIRLGLAKKHRHFTWSLDWEQNLFCGPGHNVNPRIATGLEYRFFDFLPLRAGLGYGGGQGSLYSAGFGLHLGAFRFDLGIANSGSLSPGRSKGLKLAASMSLYF